MSAHCGLQQAPSCSFRGAVWRLFAVAWIVATTCSCNWNWRGEGFKDDEGSWAQSLRPAADPKRFSGLDERAREVEQHLGVR